MEQIGFFPISNSSNIYGMTNMHGDMTRILVATLEKQVFAVEYSDNKKITCNEIHFAYIPNSADIISIDAFVRTNYNDIVLGITFFKNYKESDSNEFRKNIVVSNNRSTSSSSEKNICNHYYFNIYSSLSSTNRFDLNQIAQDCQTFELDFVPYHLYHTSIINENNIAETLWLLSGSDCYVHVFREDNKKQSFYKDKIDLFPELNNFESIVIWIDVINYEENHKCHRLTAVGCENGILCLFFVELGETNNPRIIKSWKNRFDGPILSVKFFKDKINSNLNLRKLGFKSEFSPEIHLLVLDSCEQPTIYRNVQENGLGLRKILPKINENNIDLFPASIVGDVNFDNNNEIILGSYGKKIIFYKFEHESQTYFIENTMEVPHPVISLTYLDLTGDGINELIIVTTKGIVIYRHHIDPLIDALVKKMNTIASK
ncbi:KICSTOR complex protein kaptin [Dermatophagoides farinae]|uniref:KICSTOR complex protein kaptin-like n=1 Tax=Dermatophagoides farinae TaxID=6954 RepID=A0A9D4SLT4_DERFA|nr:KICSTOR complex protein kaptin-like [Dermatophagoides farinae]XP_046918218.1 KICSTOR complex protein kaptin-like [Dermatophagoides farinae]KAH7645850.1 hypothetical protein HUG17_1388 [Dermatophagoides farinae]